MLAHEILPTQSASHYCVVLHGLGDSRRGWMPVAQELPVPGLGWVFVDAPDPYWGGFSWFPIPGMTGPGVDEAAMAKGIRRSRALTSELIAHLCARLETDSAHLVLMGFSQGCYMVLDQALRAPAAFAGVVGISGGIPFVEEYPAALGAGAPAQHILFTHGRHDTVVDPRPAQSAVRVLAEQGVNIDFRLYDKEHGLDPLDEMPAISEFLHACVASRPC